MNSPNLIKWDRNFLCWKKDSWFLNKFKKLLILQQLKKKELIQLSLIIRLRSKWCLSKPTTNLKLINRFSLIKEVLLLDLQTRCMGGNLSKNYTWKDFKDNFLVFYLQLISSNKSQNSITDTLHMLICLKSR